jgi:apolipoprotein N-acyltransferase
MGRILTIVGAVVVSGVLLVLALPPADMGWLGWFCLAPMYLVVRDKGFAVGFCAALATCMLAALFTTVGWFYPPVSIPGLPTWHFVSFFLFAFPAGLVGGLVGETKLTRGWRIWVVPAWAVLAEALLQVYLPAHLGLTQYRSASMLTVASYTGIWGVSYLLWFANLLPALLPSKRFVSALPAAALAALSLLIPFGQAGRGTPVLVGAVQDAVGFADGLARASAAPSFSGARLVVWPESGGSEAVLNGDASKLRQASEKYPGLAFVTSFADSHTPNPHNTAALFEAGRESERYNKRKLFGGERMVRTPGDRPAAADWNGTRVGLSVCFDSCYPYIMRDLARLPGVTLVALPCGGPETPFAVLQAWHGAFTPFRSAEMGVPIVRSDLSGYSQVVDSHGRIVAEAPAGMSGLLTAKVVPESRWTLYKALGDWFLWFCGVLIAAGTWASVGRRRADRGRPKHSVLPV